MFKDLKQQVKANFDKLAKTGPLFYVDIDRDLIFEKYLEGFSEETRQSHNCNCCKSFLRQYSGVVGILDNTRISIWDNITVEEEYAQSVENIRAYIASLPITNVFLVTELNCGVDKNRDRERDLVWEHFHFLAPNNLKVRRDDFDTIRGSKRTNRDTLKRALTELSIDALDTVIELIDQDSLYRGASFKSSVLTFKSLLTEYHTIEEDKKENFIWVKSNNNPLAAGFRNTSIGTLVVDLSEGRELDLAVASFENKVSGTNYKRPKPLVTQKMIDSAKQKIESLGLTNSLNRRYAKETDLNIQNVIYTDNSSALSDIFKDISKDILINPRSFSKVEEINIKDFISKVLPTVKSAEVLMEDIHRGNMMTLVTGEDPDSPSLFPWDNHFSWSYTGGITDSIKERVKAAGGAVEGVLRVSLSWSNYDDLDIHMNTPRYGHIYHGNKAGILDVDMNAGGKTSREPVENMIFKDSAPEGLYTVWVDNFSKRETKDVGYTIQIECNGEVYEFHYDDNNCKSNIRRIEFTYSPKDGIRFTADVQQLQGKVNSKTFWGIKTNTFTKVKKIMLSPNHWNDKAIGNMHYMFFLEGCEAEEQPRGFFNEFLKPEFNENRKVFELLGGKIPVNKDGGELSGLGFSETIRNHIFVKVKGSFERVLKVVF